MQENSQTRVSALKGGVNASRIKGERPFSMVVINPAMFRGVLNQGEDSFSKGLLTPPFMAEY